MRTTFEIVHGDLGAQSAVLGGGRYDGLAHSLGSSISAPGIGFSIGEDRLVMLVENTFKPPSLDVYLAFIAKGDHRDHPAGEARMLRDEGISVEVGYLPRLNRGLEVANKIGARFTLIVGDDEIAAGTYQLKDMATGHQHSLKREELAAHILGK
jgi:histidyl-tRNA synthetase